MRVLILGGGGREHALAWKLRQSARVERVLALPGSDAMAAQGVECVAGDACEAAAVLAAVRAHNAGLTVVGPEAPLAAGVADALRTAGCAVFGPSQKAARLESSKIFAKEFMARHGIPTARFAAVDTPAGARQALRRFGGVAVLKADGLAAGKGVVVPATAWEAEAAAERLLAEYGRLVVEEKLTGRELSVLAISNGEQCVLLPPARDHKRLNEGDQGPNTGGMGAICGAGLMDAAAREAIQTRVVLPTLAALEASATPFQGVLYCGLMLNAAGPQVLEYNVRFGDPEAQAILPCWHGDLAQVLSQAARGAELDPGPDASLAPWGACVVAAAEGYPGAPTRGDVIAGLDATGQSPPALIFHASTRRREGVWETGGGRVLASAATGATLPEALAAGYRAFEAIHFRGMQWRRDIGR
ncbi:MAG: phosphoribosylamine--glycine ligase [Terriglobales bacterium]